MKSFPCLLQSSRITALIATSVIFLWGILSTAAAEDSFFSEKTVTIIQGRDPGGTGDVRVRAMVPFLVKHIPGHPTIVMEYMPGGGGRKTANHIYTSATPDGLTIGNVSNGIVAFALLGGPGVLYDIDKFFYLGSPISSHHAVFVTRKQAGFSALEKLREAKGIRIGGQSVGFSTYNEGRIFAYFLSLKAPSFVTGYGGAELDPALMRGEIDARATSADTILRRNPKWLEGGSVDFHAIIEVPKGEKHPRFPQLPDIETFAESAIDHKIIAMQRAFRGTGQPFVLPPGTPKDRVAILQEAFRKTYKDPEFQAEFKKITRDDPSPLMPEDHEKVIREIPRDPEAGAIFNKIIGPGPLPTRTH